jgi:hypothetical protein
MDLRAAILAAGRKPEKFTCEDLGLEVWLRRLTGEEAEEYFAAADGKATTTQLMRIMASFCLCEENGSRIFARPDDLKGVAYPALECIALEAMRLNGFTAAAAEEVKKKAAATSGTTSRGDSAAQSRKPGKQ